jgi:hypothetical protein
MNQEEKKRLLTKAKKQEIWLKIEESLEEDDKDPQDVIREKFDGDADAYLLIMAKWHGISLGE